MNVIINRFPLFEVDGLNIRLAELRDVKSIQNYFVQNRRYLKKWEPKRSESFFTEIGWQNRLEQQEKIHQHGLGYYFLIFTSEHEIVGVISFNHVLRFPIYSVNVGYSIAKKMQSKGIMTKALSITCQWMFDEIHLHRITAFYMPRNKASARVLEKIGFKKEGLATSYLLINDKWEDHVLTALINKNWSEP